MAAKSTKTNTKKAKTHKSPRTHRPKRQSPWDDDLGIGYATYDHEEDYQSPADLDDEQLDTLRSFNQRLATSPILVDDYV